MGRVAAFGKPKGDDRWENEKKKLYGQGDDLNLEWEVSYSGVHTCQKSSKYRLKICVLLGVMILQ